MKHERGFALITVLWFIALLTAAVGLGVSTTRIGQRTTMNRIALTRGRWAAEACLAVAAARWKATSLDDIASFELGGRTWCRWEVLDPGSRINVNSADRDLLLAVGLDSLQVTKLLQARPLYSLSQLGLPDSMFTVDGPGTVNLNAASPAILNALPGLTSEAVDHITIRRVLDRPVRSLDELGGLLSPASRSTLLARYADLARLVTFAPTRLLITATGWVADQKPRSNIEITVVPLPDRLAVIRRRMW
jgi:hypothetical protein